MCIRDRHETGHALYNLGLPNKWKYQPVGDALGTVVHESQSLFMEMQVCRSYEFLNFASPFIRKIFKKNGIKWRADNLYKIYTFVKPSFIRVDADEVTYPLHIFVRYKIEKELIEGNMKVKEIPKVWNMFMKKYLVKEIFGPTIEGEGSQAGAPVLFLRLSGCNKWSGKDEEPVQKR